MPFVKIKNNIKLYYEDSGDGVPPLFFIHGWTANSWVWKNQKEYFSSRYKVILIDLKGHGKSDKKPGNYTIPEYASEVYEAITRIVPNEKVVLIGHSMGGMITLYCATDVEFSKKLKGIVLMSTSSRKLSSAKLLLNDIKSGNVSLDDPKMIEEIAKTGFYSKFIRQNKDVLKLNIEEAKKCPKEVALASMEYFVTEYDVSDKLSQISVPTLIMAGDKDLQISNNEAQFMIEKIPNAKFEIVGPKAGHMIQYEKPEVVNKLIEEFIKDL
ncbi:MAG: alpha/beta fold hydrolase [Candidatus Helarchaeota archaeon]